MLQEFLEPMEILPPRFAARIGVSAFQIDELIHGRLGITPEMASLLSAALETTPAFWTNLQAQYDASIGCGRRDE